MQPRALALVLVAVLASPAAAQLMVADAGPPGRIMLLSQTDGSPINLNWITSAGAQGWAFSTPMEALAVNNEIWVSDQTGGAVLRFSRSTRQYLSSITTRPGGAALDNLRGMSTDGDYVFLAQFPAASPGRGVVTFDTNGTPLSFFHLNLSLFDVAQFEGGVLVSSANHNHILRYTREGVYINDFALNLTAPRQVEPLPDGSVIVIASGGSPEVRGLHHRNPIGTPRTFVPVSPLEATIGEFAVRGGYPLAGGGYLIATSRGVFRATPTGQDEYAFTPVVPDVDAHYITPLTDAAPPPPPPCPADWSGDGVVNSSDLSAFITSWIASVQNGTLAADFSGDGVVNSTDISMFITAWLSAVATGC